MHAQAILVLNLLTLSPIKALSVSLLTSPSKVTNPREMAYLAPIHRGTSVRHAIKLNLLSPDEESLVLA